MNLRQLAQGMMVAKALRTMAEPGIADLLKDGPRSAEELAQASSTREPSLFRLLRALASSGIFPQDEDGRFRTPRFRTRSRAMHDGNMLTWKRLMDVVKTCEPSFMPANGVDIWEYLKLRPQLESRFNRAMTLRFGGSRREARRFLRTGNC